MDFLSLPRRDLQALCKRNGVRANMTNAAMAEALAALPAVDGIEEYVKQPVAVPAPAPVEEEEEVEPRLEKQGSPLPRGRRVTAKAKEPTKPEDAKQANATRERNTEDAPALGVGWRGASRRARPAPVVPKPTGKASAEEEAQGCSPLVEAGEAEEDLKREANKEDAPAPVVGRRGASRRARPAPAAESTGAGVGEEQREKQESQVPRGRRGVVKSSEPDDREETTEKEDLKQKAGTDGAPAHGVGRRGPSRLARPAPALEEQTAPIPRGRNLKAKSTEPNDGEEEKEGGKPEEVADVSALVVGRRGASRRARGAPAVAAPAGNVAAEEEPTAPIQGSHTVSVKSPEVIRLDDSEEDEKEDTKSEEKVEDLPAIGVGRRGASRRALAPAEAPATRRRAATSKPEARDVAIEAVTIRSTRQRKPTMKAVVVAEEKAPRRAPRRGTVKKTVLQQEEQQEPQGVISDAEAVPAPVSDQGCDGPGDLKECSQNEIQNEVVDAPKQEDEDVVIIEDEVVMVQIPAEDPLVISQERVDISTLKEQQVDDEKCPARLDNQEDSPILGLVSMAAVVDKVANFQDTEGSNEEPLLEKIHDAGEEMEMVSSIQVLEAPLTPTDRESTKEVVTGDANHESEMGGLNEVLHSREEISEVVTEDDVDTEDDVVSQEKENIDIDELQTELANEAILFDCSGNISMVDEEKTNKVNTEDGLGCQQKGDVAVDTVLPDREEISEVNTEDDLISQKKDNMDIDELQTELGDETVLSDCSGNTSLVYEEKTNEVNTEDGLGCQQKGDVAVDTVLPDREEISEVNTEDDLISQKKDNMDIDELQTELGDETVLSDCSGNTSLVYEEKTNEVNTEDGPGCQQKRDVAVDTVLPYKADDTILLDGSDMNIKVLEETVDVEEVTNEMRQIAAALDEDGGEADLCTDTCDAGQQNEVASLDNIGQVAVENGDAVEENSAAVTRDMPNSTGVVDEHDEETEIHSDKQKEVVTAEKEPQADVGFFQEKGFPDERQQIMATADEVIGDDHVDIYFDQADKRMELVADDNVPEQAGTDHEGIAQEKAAVFTEEMPPSTATMDEDIEEDQLHAVSDDQAVVTNSLLKVKMTEDEFDVEGTAPITDEMQQSTVTMNEDGVHDHFETGVIHADEQEQVVTTEEATELPRTVGEIVEEDKEVVITEEVPQSTRTMDEYVEEDQLQIDFAHADDNVTEMKEAEDGIVTNDHPQQLVLAGETNDHITSALLDGITESLSKSITTLEPTESVFKNTSVCNNSNEKYTTEPPVEMQEEKGVKVAKKSVDLTKLSIRQLRTKIKEKLNAKKNKEAKRVALARVDENVCRSQSKGQQQNLNLQQH